MLNLQKTAVIGCGLVGATSAYSLMQSALFSELVLIDLDRHRAEGEAADLNHALPFLSPMEIYAGNYSDLRDAATIVITAGTSQRAGQTRLDLVRENTEIMRSIVERIIQYNEEAILLIVSNPVDILTYAAHVLSGFPPSRVIGSGTVLDTARLKALIGGHFGVDTRNVHSFIIGEHGDSELAVWSSANVSGIDLDRFCESCRSPCNRKRLDELFAEAKNSAYHIISAKGATYYAIAEAVRKILCAIVKDERTILPVSSVLHGQYGLSDVALGIPCVVGKDGIREVLEIPLNQGEREQLMRSASKLSGVLEGLGLPTRTSVYR